MKAKLIAARAARPDDKAAGIAGSTEDGTGKIVVEIGGEVAEVIAELAQWMCWRPEDVAHALVAGQFEAWDDDRELVQLCMNARERYCATGRVHEAWRPWTRKGVES